MALPIANALISGFLAGFKSAERYKYGRDKRIHFVRHYPKEQSKLTIQGIRSPYSRQEKDTPLELTRKP